MAATYISKSYVPLEREPRAAIEEIPHVAGQIYKPMGASVIRFLEKGTCVIDEDTIADIAAGAESATVFTLYTILHGTYTNAIKRNFTLPVFKGIAVVDGVEKPIGDYTITWECRTEVR
jgi:hypothetical protein